MGYSYIDDAPQGDAAFRATGSTLEELFNESWKAALDVMTENSFEISDSEIRETVLEGDDIEMLLFDFLNEQLFYKDSESLLLRVDSINITEKPEKGYRLYAQLKGSAIDKEQTILGTDVKAVTLHRFSVKKTATGWESTVILDT
jgi:SHS2 domain-containing protein